MDLLFQCISCQESFSPEQMCRARCTHICVLWNPRISALLNTVLCGFHALEHEGHSPERRPSWFVFSSLTIGPFLICDGVPCFAVCRSFGRNFQNTHWLRASENRFSSSAKATHQFFLGSLHAPSLVRGANFQTRIQQNCKRPHTALVTSYVWHTDTRLRRNLS